MCLFLVFLGSLAAQDRSNWIFNTFNGRFQCNGQSMDFQLTFHPATGLLGMDDEGSVTAVLRLDYHTSLTSVDQAVYKLAGPYAATAWMVTECIQCTYDKKPNC